MSSFSKSVGGCPANIAIGTSRLGLKVAMITRVGDEQMGRYLRETMEKEGVDASYIVTDKERLTTVVFLSIRDERTFPLLFYREKCADMGLCEADIKEEAIAETYAILCSGVHLSSATTTQALFRAIALAKKHKARIIFDVDYRPTLWGLTGLGEGESRYVESAEVTKNIQEILPDCDLIVGTQEEFNIAGGSQDPYRSLQNIRTISKAVFAFKMGAEGCCVIPNEVPHRLQATGKLFAIKILNTIGAGDAFMSGFLRGYLRNEDWETCATWGNAAGALVVTRHACSPESPSWEELQVFVKNHQNLPSRPDENAGFRHLHYATNRARKWRNLRILAYDHRPQFEAMAREAKVADAAQKISHAKQLIFQAFQEVVAEWRGNEGEFGFLCDHRYGEEILRQAAADWWVGRPVEKPHSRPLDFDFSNDLSAVIRHFPASHTVKCLFFHHSNDDEELRNMQLNQVQRLYQICMDTGHELLLELIPPVDTDELEISRGMAQVYAKDVFPAWWKLPAFSSQSGWDAAAKTITSYDGHCRGVLLLGLDKPIDRLRQEFSLASRQECCKGFAIGRSIFGNACKEWFAGKKNDIALVTQIKQNFITVINHWESCRDENC